MKYLTLILILLPILGKTQSFYVDGKDNKSREHVEAKIKFEGYKVTADSSVADYLVQMLTDGAYKVVSFKRPYKAYIRILDNRSGQEVARTHLAKGSPTVYNGFNASYSIYSKICKKYLLAELRKCKSKS